MDRIYAQSYESSPTKRLPLPAGPVRLERPAALFHSLAEKQMAILGHVTES
jgi:hypothetical protein